MFFVLGEPLPEREENESALLSFFIHKSPLVCVRNLKKVEKTIYTWVHLLKDIPFREGPIGSGKLKPLGRLTQLTSKYRRGQLPPVNPPALEENQLC